MSELSAAFRSIDSTLDSIIEGRRREYERKQELDESRKRFEIQQQTIKRQEKVQSSLTRASRMIKLLNEADSSAQKKHLMKLFDSKVMGSLEPEDAAIVRGKLISTPLGTIAKKTEEWKAMKGPRPATTIDPSIDINGYFTQQVAGERWDSGQAFYSRGIKIPSEPVTFKAVNEKNYLRSISDAGVVSGVLVEDAHVLDLAKKYNMSPTEILSGKKANIASFQIATDKGLALANVQEMPADGSRSTQIVPISGLGGGQVQGPTKASARREKKSYSSIAPNVIKARDNIAKGIHGDEKAEQSADYLFWKTQKEQVEKSMNIEDSQILYEIMEDRLSARYKNHRFHIFSKSEMDKPTFGWSGIFGNTTFTEGDDFYMVVNKGTPVSFRNLKGGIENYDYDATTDEVWDMAGNLLGTLEETRALVANSIADNKQEK